MRVGMWPYHPDLLATPVPRYTSFPTAAEFGPLDDGAYADAIGRLITDDALRLAAGRAGHAKADGYQWDAINEAVLQAYLRVIARRG